MSNPSSLLEFDTFGEFLRHLRRRARLTQRDLGQAVGYSEAHITRLENGQRLPDRATVKGLFVEVLDLKNEPDLAKRLIELAAKARGEVSPMEEQERRADKRARTNLPAQLTSFIGREQEIAEVKELLDTARLLTVIGAGGVGKTRLAQEVAAGLLDANAFADGMWYVELAALTDSALVPQAVASTLKLIEQQGRTSFDTVADYFQAKQALLILDNCEHLIAACADLVVKLLERCPKLRMLATSRETLRIPGETVYRVPSLTIPPLAYKASDLSNYESVRLFIERAHASQPALELAPTHAADVVQICRRLDGIPLALELAAARLKVLSIVQIAARLDDRFNLLTSGVRTALPRQQTLRATIAWSVDLLSEAERELLARLWVFAGGFTTDAAQAISDQHNALDVLSSLVDKSLVIADVQTEHARYRMLETIRQYAAEQLAHAGQTRAAHERHYDVFLRLAEQAEPLLQSAHREPWLNCLDLELDNLRAALIWCRESGNDEKLLRLAGALWWFWNLRGHMGEGRRWLEEGLALMGAHGDSALRAKALYVAGSLAWLQNDFETAYHQNFESVQLMREQGDKHALAYALSRLALAASRTTSGTDSDLARAAGEEGVSLLRQLGDRWGLALALDFLAIVLRDREEFDAALSAFEESLSIFRDLGDGWGVAMALNGLGMTHFVLADFAAARTLVEEAARLRASARDKAMTAVSLLVLGEVAERQADYQEAAECYRQALALDWGIGNGLKALKHLERIASLDALRGDFERCVRLCAAVHTLGKHDAIDIPDLATMRTQLGEVTFTEAWARGSVMTLDEAVEEALKV